MKILFIIYAVSWLILLVIEICSRYQKKAVPMPNESLGFYLFIIIVSPFIILAIPYVAISEYISRKKRENLKAELQKEMKRTMGKKQIQKSISDETCLSNASKRKTVKAKTLFKLKKQCKCNLPEDFKCDSRTYIYMESKHDRMLNLFIKLNYKWLDAEFNERGLNFVYLPKMAEILADEKYIRYLLPASTNKIKFDTADIYKTLFKGIDDAPKSPFIMRIDKAYTISYPLEYEYVADIWELKQCGYFGIKSQITVLLEYIDEEMIKLLKMFRNAEFSKDFGGIPNDDDKDSDLRFRVAKPKKNDGVRLTEVETEEDDILFRLDDEEYETSVKLVDADERFEFYIENAEYIEATNQIFDGIRRLHDLGLGSLIIQSIAQRNTRISRIHIDDDYNITLPDYNNMKIDMAPMTKALFLLFLRHKEGIAIKDLPDYRNELTALYWDMIKSNDEDAVMETIDRVTNPFNNDINVHCSRIKSAFTFKFNAELAANYYVVGKRGEPKRITLPRELVEWDD